MKFEWDGLKARRNIIKHSIDFADAATIFEDDLAITILDENAEEERFITIGTDSMGRLLVVVYTLRDEQIRIISARRATPRERAEYERTQR